MVILHKYVPAWDMADISPFCIKVETYLRMVGVPFEPRTSDVRKAPKGKLPYIEDGASVICDSRDIIAHFEAKLPNALDRELSARDRALSAAFQALLEEEAYFYAIVLRWREDDGWAIYKPALQRYLAAIGVPSLLAPLVAASARRGVVAQAKAQGSARHSRGEIEQRLLATAQAAINQVGDGPFFLGPRPHVIDATMFAFLSAALDSPFRSRAKDMLAKADNVLAYRERMRAAYFPR